MAEFIKARSPFSPGQPAGIDIFVGRDAQITRLLQRGAGQTALGKPTAFFIEGEYGIGKSSLANYCLQAAERQHGLLGVTVSLAGMRDLPAVAEAVLKALIAASAQDKGRWEAMADAFRKFTKGLTLFGVELDLEALRREAPAFADAGGFLALVRTVVDRLSAHKQTPIRGLFLVLDEINGVAADLRFAHFLKGVVDRNALASHPVPFCLVLCGTPERRRELIAAHEPVGRIFDVVDVPPLTDSESRQLLDRAFASVNMRVDPIAMDGLVRQGSGQPRILHMLGDQAYWSDTDGVIDRGDSVRALVGAAEEFTRKFVDPQILAEVRSADYRSILHKISGMDPVAASFTKKDVAEGLSEAERKKLDNFLQRMKALNVLRPGDNRGEWVFNMPLVRTALFLLGKAGEAARG